MTTFVLRHLSSKPVILEQETGVQDLNTVAARVANAANERLGHGYADMHYVRDDDRVSAIVNIQFGKRGNLGNSEVCRVEIHHPESIKLILTDTVARAVGAEQYNAFNDVEAAVEFIGQLESKLRA